MADFDRGDFDDIRETCTRLKGIYSGRDTLYEELRRMVHMEWSEQPTGDWIKSPMSPSAYNALIGAVRLMVSTEPQINVPFDEAQTQAKQASGKIEQACKAMWAGSGRIAQRPVHYEVVFSALMFAEICASVTRTADLLKHAEGTQNPALMRRMERVAQTTPYMFTCYNPATCYGDFDLYGLRGMLRRTATRWGEVLATWGDLAEAALGKRAGALKVFDLPERQRFPLLYAMHKSELWKRENLGLTVIYSLIHALGSNPLLVQETDDVEAPTTVDRSVPGGILKVPKGERPSGLLEKVVDPEQYKGLDLAARLNEESTIPKMALGAPPQQVMAFSAISLLVQSGRLPLTATKQLGGEAIANLLIAALAWYKADPPEGGKFYDYGKGSYLELSPGDIPERLALRVNLEPDLPTDKLQLAQVGQALVRDKLASRRWVRENILSTGQSEAMDKEIWTEERVSFEIQRIFQQLSAQDQLKIQQAAQAMQAQASGAVEQMAGPMHEQMMAAQGSPPTQGPGGPPQGESEIAPAGAAGGNAGGGGQEVSPYPPGGVGEGRPMTGPMPPRGQAR